MKYSPVVLFVYNRPEHTKRALESLKANHISRDSELFVYADGPKDSDNEQCRSAIRRVREIVREKDWCGKVSVIESDINKGLADSIIDGVSEIVYRYGKVIVLEDDLLLSPGFLQYMNDALALYENDEQVMHISGYMYPVTGRLPNTFFVNIATCWGWATWERAWKYFEPNPVVLLEKITKTPSMSRFNLEGGYDWLSHLEANAAGSMRTWAIRWYASFYLHEGFCLHPKISLVRNVGNDGSGVHCGRDHVLLNQKIASLTHIQRIPIRESVQARLLIKEYFLNRHNPSIKNNTLKSCIMHALESLGFSRYRYPHK